MVRSALIMTLRYSSIRKLQSDRTFLGNMMGGIPYDHPYLLQQLTTLCLTGSLESWLLLRSLRTFHLRIVRQSETATALVKWLHQLASTPVGSSFEGVPGGVLSKVWHSSLQGKDGRGFEPSEQMTGGWNATFSIQLSQSNYAAWFPHSLKYFTVSSSLLPFRSFRATVISR
jgi:cystathionine beta-lyase/cystathionine gamma-synthase